MTIAAAAPQSIKHTAKISVLLPVFNAERHLHEAVDSVLNQSFEDFELLALDDGSTDTSLRLLREYERKDARIRVRTRENRGLVVTLNELIAEACGTYLARMDADDICMPERFDTQVSFLDASPKHVAVGGWVERINADGLPIGIIEMPVSHEEIDAAHLKGHTSIWHPTVMMRKSAVTGVGGYRVDYTHGEDLDLWLRLAEVGQLANLPEVVLRYRLHSNSISEVNAQAQQDAGLRACRSAWRRRDVEGRYEVSEHWRPKNNRVSRHQFALRYGWAAWHSGHRQTWWFYAREALGLRPFALSTWRLLFFGGLKRPVKK